jgi:hypothetical protein
LLPLSTATILFFNQPFFCFSGGQESDHGTIGGIEVASARRVGLKINYTLPDNHGLTVGKLAEINID